MRLALALPPSMRQQRRRVQISSDLSHTARTARFLARYAYFNLISETLVSNGSPETFNIELHWETDDAKCTSHKHGRTAHNNLSPENTRQKTRTSIQTHFYPINLCAWRLIHVCNELYAVSNIKHARENSSVVCVHATTWFVFVRHKMYRFRLDITQVTLTWQAKGVPWTPRRWIKFRKPSLARVTSCLNPLDGRMYTITQKSCVHVTLVVLLPLLARD